MFIRQIGPAVAWQAKKMNIRHCAPLPRKRPFSLNTKTMLLYNVLFLAIAAAALTFIFSYIFKSPGPWGSFWAFLGILFLAMFAFSLWVTPVGPVWHNIAWFDTLLVGLVLALLLGAAGESRKKTRHFKQTEKGEVDLVAEANAEVGATALFGIFFWIFMVVMSILVIGGLVRLFRSF